ncbi:YDG domain-containing protein [Faecalibacillus faecis]|uniref:YDG domain-containing protein n=1 Tax=Faecalibacillus faecis TaxID=1982628 RepID=UPI003FD6C080
MKIKIKKIIASILTFMMIFTQVPVNVFAAELEVSNNDKVSNTEKSTLKESYGILKQSKNLLSVFTLKNNNYLNSNANTESEQTFRVILPDEQIGYTLTVDKSEVEYGGSCTLTFALQEGYVKTGDFRIFSNEKIIYPNDDDKNKYTIKNIQNDITITVTGVNDNTSPDVRITIGDNTWNSFKGVISYGKYFFNKKQNATITATDRSGINKCYYAIDATGNDFNRPTVTNSELDKTLNWIELEGNSISLSGYDHCIIFVKAIDKCGNTTYIVTDGLTLDSTAPQVSGVESNKTYTKSKSFTVVEDNLATVKVDGQTVEPTNGKYTLVPKDGTYTIEVKDKAGNKITLNNITVNWDEVEIPTVESKVYTGQTLTANISENALYTVTENKGGNNVGKYKVQLELKDPTNYKWRNGDSTATATIEFEIVKAQREAPTSVTATGTTYKGGTDGKLNNVDSSMEYRKDGENEWHSISGDTVEGLSTGKYYVRYKDSKNYYASSDKEVYVANGQEIKVKVSASQVGYTLSVSNTVVDYNESSTLTFALNKGYSKTKDFAVKVNGETVQLDNNNQYKIKNIQKDTNITVEGVADITAPDTEIKVSNKTWKSILNTITFGLFFKETQKAEITATDEGSGVNKYYYYVDKSGSEKSLTEKQLQAVDWKEGTSVTFNEDSNYVIYAKVTDKAGNIKYVSTDGIVIDMIAPQVLGVESGQTYTKTQTFTVTDNNLDTVKVDDKVVTSYTLVPKKGTYTIEVTDKSGNKTTLNNITVNWEKVKKPTVESKVYTGQTLTANISENGLYTVKENNGGINVGEYDVQLTLKDPTNYRWKDGTVDTTVKFNITKATPVVTQPTTKTLTYNGSEQELVNAASTNGGTVKYSLDNKNWSTSIPTEKDAKEYTVYYKVEGNKNFKDVDVQEITNKINPRTIDLNWNNELTYNGKEQLPTATVNNLVDSDKCEVTVDGAQHKNVGTYKDAAKATKVSNQNYKLPENVTTSYTIGKKQLSIEGLKAVNRKYNGTSEVALQGGKLTGVVGNDEVSIDMPKMGTVESSNAGENKAVSYTKSALSGEDKDNYELLETVWPALTVTISKTDESNTVITTTKNELDKTYDGYEVVDVKSTSNNKTTPVVEYSLKGKNEYSTTKPKNAGEYTVRVTYPADDNYEKSSVTKDFTIKKMKTRVSAIDLSKTYGEKGYELMYSFDRLAREDRLTGIILTRQEGEDVGTYKIKVSQKEGSNPNYDITFKDGTYTINPLSIDKGTVVLGNVLKYTGEKQTQEVEQVLVNGKALNKEDYEVLDNQATKEGKHVLTIKAKGNNHTGSFEYSYAILPKENDKIGTGSFTVKTTGDVEISREEVIDLLIENKEITANELSEIAEGKKVEIVLEVKEAQANELIETNTKGYKVGKYLDITLYKSVNGTNESIHELTKVLKVTIKVPEELINKDSKTKREYFIARSHNGKVDILETKYDEKTNSLTFETDKFSDYAILYKDMKEKETVKPTVKVETTNKETVKAENKKEVKKVKTGDSTNSVLYLGLFGFSLLIIYCIVMKKFIR